jgi:23S rRNA pseudouridine2605 synthase
MRKRSHLLPGYARQKPGPGPARGHGLARVLSKLGVCSRSRAGEWIRAGRVSVDGRMVRDPEQRTGPKAAIAVDGIPLQAGERVCIALNKPRGVTVTASDERGRATVYDLLKDAGLPWLAPVGRLDKASEGLLLMGNDPEWAARITDPTSHLPKTYHVQVRGVPDADTLQRLRAGVTDRGEELSARSVALLRAGEKNAWLEIVLDQGRNRQIRRMLAALDFEVLRLIRVAIGPLALGKLAKGAWRKLGTAETAALVPEPGKLRPSTDPARARRK